MLKKSTASKLLVEDYTIGDHFLQVLEEHKKSCQREGKFEEAELTMRKLREFRKYEDKKQKQILTNHHKAEQQALKAKFKEEMDALVEKWDIDVLAKYRNQAEGQMFQIKKRQDNEFTTLQASRRSKSVLPHQSRHIKELRRKQEHLSLFGKYQEAIKLDKQIKKFSSVSSKTTESKVMESINTKLMKMQSKHKKEISALEMKIKSKWVELWNQREKALNNTKLKYENAKRELDQRFNADRLRLKRLSRVKKMTIKERISEFSQSLPLWNQINQD